MTDLPHITANDLGAQVFIHRERPEPSRFDRPTNKNDLMCKPDGGLWTSTLRSDGTTAWGEWCRAEDFAGGEYPRWRLEPAPTVQLYEVDTEADLLRLLDVYQRTDTGSRRYPSGTTVGDHPDSVGAYPSGTFAQIDFEQMHAEGWDGIHLTEHGQRETRFSTPGLYGWDCESTLWLYWAFLLPAERLDTVRLGRDDGSNAKVSGEEHNDETRSEAQ